MTNQGPVHGLWCAMLTPLDAAGAVDHRRLVQHAQWLISNDVDGVAPFGTTGEGQSFSVGERIAATDALLDGGIPGTQVVAATGCAALPETTALTRHAVQVGCAASLVLPPFFWKDLTDDGLFAWYAKLIDDVADARLRIYLYHIPQVSGVPLSVDLVARLAAAFPGVIAGVKDSAGDWNNTRALLTRVPQLGIMVGHEPHLPQLMREGGVGTICGAANIFPSLVRKLFAGATPEDEKRIATFIDIAFRQPLLPGFKAIVAARHRDPGWLAVRPPLLPLEAGARERLLRALEEAAMPSLAL